MPVPEAPLAPVRFGEFTVDPVRGCLRRGEAEVPLRPKSFALLQYLVANAGRLIGKDELLAAIWPNAVVTEDSLTRCVSEVRAALGDGAQRIVKTVPRRGYLFDAPVTAEALPAAPPSPEAPAARAAPAAFEPTAPSAPVDIAAVTEPAAASRPSTARRFRSLALAISVFAIAAVATHLLLGRRHEPPRLTLVVLPFAGLGAEPGQGYLADIVTNDLTLALSRLRGATVIATGSAFTLRDATPDLRRLGAELPARYAVQGSVQRSGERLRVGARLLDTRDASTLWSDQFDVARGELARAQDEIVVRLASALSVELVKAESRRSAAAEGKTLDAEDLAMQCVAGSLRSRSGTEAAKGKALCEQALLLDPRNLRALAWLASFHAERVSRVQSSEPEADLARAEDLVARALAVDPADYAAHCAKATVLEGRHRVREAVASAERCLALNPSDAGAYRILAAEHFFLAEPEKTLDYAERGVRLSPRDPQLSTFLLFKGWANFQMGRDEEALAWLQRAAAATPDSPNILAALASEQALTGHGADAKATMARYLAAPRTRTKTLAEWNHEPDDNAAFKAFGERFKEGLRRAGMPER